MWSSGSIGKVVWTEVRKRKKNTMSGIWYKYWETDLYFIKAILSKTVSVSSHSQNEFTVNKPWLMRLFPMQIWILCKLFKYVLESLGSDVEMLPCLSISVKETALMTKKFLRVEVLPTGSRLDCGTEKMSLYSPIPDICLPLTTGGEGRALARAVLAEQKPLPTTALCKLEKLRPGEWGELR